jgi:hypothetical protein
VVPGNRDGGADVYPHRGEPTFIPVMRPEAYSEAIANARRIVFPPRLEEAIFTTGEPSGDEED